MARIEPQKIIVLGGTGFVGRHICERLSQQGHQVTVPTRRLPHARHLQVLPGVTAVQADVHHPQELQQLVRGHDVVVNLIAILHGTQAEFDKAHVNLPIQLARACYLEGVKHVVHVSALGADTHGPSMYQRSKARGEAALASAAHRNGLMLSVLRPSVIFGEDDSFINLFAKLQRISPIMPLAGANTRFQPVWVQDVADAVVHCIHFPHATQQVYEACGPEVFTLRQLVEHAGRWVGHARPVIPLPYPAGWLQALVLELAPGPTLMSRDNLASMKVDNIATGRYPGLHELGILAPTPLRQVFPPAID